MRSSLTDYLSGQYHLLGGLALPLPVLEIGKPHPVEDEDRHAEDEEEGEAVSLLLGGAVAEEDLGEEETNSQDDVNISTVMSY